MYGLDLCRSNMFRTKSKYITYHCPYGHLIFLDVVMGETLGLKIFTYQWILAHEFSPPVSVSSEEIYKNKYKVATKSNH